MITNFIDINSFKENVEKKAQDLKQECSAKGIDAGSTLNKLYELLLENIKFITETIYQEYLYKKINEGYEISVDDLVKKIVEIVENEFFEYYFLLLLSLNIGAMVNIEIKNGDKDLFLKKAKEILKSQCYKIKAKYRNILNQQEYNKRILGVAIVSKWAAIIAAIVPILIYLCEHFNQIKKIIF